MFSIHNNLYVTSIFMYYIFAMNSFLTILQRATRVFREHSVGMTAMRKVFREHLVGITAMRHESSYE